LWGGGKGGNGEPARKFLRKGGKGLIGARRKNRSLFPTRQNEVLRGEKKKGVLRTLLSGEEKTGKEKHGDARAPGSEEKRKSRSWGLQTTNPRF